MKNGKILEFLQKKIIIKLLSKNLRLYILGPSDKWQMGESSKMVLGRN